MGLLPKIIVNHENTSEAHPTTLVPTSTIFLPHEILQTRPLGKNYPCKPIFKPKRKIPNRTLPSQH